MNFPDKLPHSRVLLDGLKVTHERLRLSSKAAVPLPLLRAILSVAVRQFPFDEEFYLQSYPDVREAYHGGTISDLRDHFVNDGYFEGRLGSLSDFDEKFYLETYPDIAAAIANGSIESAADHYMRAGAAEGRCANEAHWNLHRIWSAYF